jgi:hypothetical protein
VMRNVTRPGCAVPERRKWNSDGFPAVTRTDEAADVVVATTTAAATAVAATASDFFTRAS